LVDVSTVSAGAADRREYTLQFADSDKCADNRDVQRAEVRHHVAEGRDRIDMVVERTQQEQED